MNWKHFDSAPKDGSEIIVFREDAGVFTASFGEDDDITAGGCWFDSVGEDLTGDLPTHWQPLPAPPIPAAAKNL